MGDQLGPKSAFATQEHHRAKPDPLHDKSPTARTLPLYQPRDVTYDAEAGTCVCPARKSLDRTGQNVVTKGYAADHCRGAKQDCVPCAQCAQCLRHPETTPTRQVAFLHGRAPDAPETQAARMNARSDSLEGRAQYAARFGTVEPVFANVCYNKGLARFTLRGQPKVDGQWKLFCVVHNIEKLARHGYAQ